MEPWLESFALAGFRRSADTAHDLKTPLNVAVLNLELLRMRLRKLLESEDEKALEYARAIESELRRMGHIFDTFFILSAPPKDEGAPMAGDIGPACVEAASAAGHELAGVTFRAMVHQSRIRQAFKLFFEGAASVLHFESHRPDVHINGSFLLTMRGTPRSEDFETTKIFKFYYTDAAGNPDLSLAAARLIVEAYGGELRAEQERDTVALRLSLPPGEP